MKIILLILTFFGALNSKAQDIPEEIIPETDKLIERIDSLQKNEYDTVVAYIFRKGYPDMEMYSLKGAGKVHIFREAVVIGFKKNTINCIRFIDTFDSVFESKPVILKPDSFLQVMRAQIGKCSNEIFLPYVCELVPDSATNIKAFYPLNPNLHEPSTMLYFNCCTDEYWKEFYFRSVDEYLNAGFPVNLNFTYNSSLNLYKFYFYLNTLLNKPRDTFYFGK